MGWRGGGGLAFVSTIFKCFKYFFIVFHIFDVLDPPKSESEATHSLWCGSEERSEGVACE